MAITIIQSDNPLLRRIAEPLEPQDFGSRELTKIINDMNSALDQEEDGVAIAAPQIAVSRRIFIVSRKILPTRAGQKASNLIFINPILKKLSARKVKMEEGCLSVRWKYGFTRRAESATVEAYNERGNKFVKSGKGLLAQIFQHEIDHLNGILFIDKATNVIEVNDDETASV